MAVTIDANKVNSYILPNIDKLKGYLESAYSNANSLCYSLPGSFIYRSTTSELSTNIYNCKIKVPSIKALISSTVSTAESIERQTAQRVNDMTNSYNSTVTTTPKAAETVKEEKVSFFGDFKDNWLTGIDMIFGGKKKDKITFEEFLATSTNALIGFTEGMLDVAENIGDAALTIGGTVISGYASIVDLCRGDLDASCYNAVMDWTRATVANDWTNDLHDFYYEDYGAILDEYSADVMDSDSSGYQIAKQAGTIVSTIAISTSGTPIGAGSSAAASQAANMALVGATNSFGSNIGNEWNKNSITISYDGINTMDLNIDYETYNRMDSLNPGESLNISQSYMLEDGSIQNITFTFIKNEDGSISSYDSIGNVVNTHSLNESNTYKSMAKSAVKAAWDGAQFYVGGKIAGAQFSNITGKISNSYLQVAAQSGMRMGLDGLTGAVEVPVQAGIDCLFDNISYKEAWNNQGGWNAFKTQTLFALGSSALGEGASYKNNVQTNQLTNILQTGDSHLIASSLNSYKPGIINRTLSEMKSDDVSKLLKVSDINTQFKLFNSMDVDMFSKYYKAIESDELDIIIKNMDERVYKNLIENLENNKMANISDEVKNIRTGVSCDDNNLLFIKNNLTKDNFIDFINSPENKDVIENYKKEILNKIILNQDQFFLSKDMFNQSSLINKIEKLADNDELFYKSLSDKNLIKFFFINKYNMSCLDEIKIRIDEGSSLFSQYPVIYNSFGIELIDSKHVFSNIPKEYSEKALKLASSDWNYVPQELKKLEYGSTFFNQGLLGSLFRENRIDSKGISIIKELYDKNHLTLEKFNFELLDSNILSKLDNDFIKQIGIYDEYSTRIISLYKNSPKIFDEFCNIINKCKLDDSLFTFYPKTKSVLNYLFDNQKTISLFNVDSDSLVNYILYKNNSFFQTGQNFNRINIDFNNDYYTLFKGECDKNFIEAYEHFNNLKIDILKKRYITDMKNVYFQKYFSISFEEAQMFLSKYGDDINSVIKYDDNGCSTVLSFMKKIVGIDDVEELKRIYDEQKISFSSEEMLYFDNSLKRLYNYSYIDSLSNTQRTLDSSEDFTLVDYQGKQIKVINSGNDFSMFVHSTGTGFVIDKTSIANNSYVSDWSNLNPNTHGLATSFISNTNIGCCPVLDKGVMYGFTDLSVDNIAIISTSDVNSHIANFGFGYGNNAKYVSSENMSNETLRVYNEVVLDRTKVKPNYVILFDDASESIIENAYKAASDWDIPIVRINKTELANTQINNINNLLDEFDASGDLSKLSESINLFEANTSGYKLNTIYKDNDPTNSINNESLREVFNSERITNTIKNYIDNCSTEEEVNSMINILEDVNRRYKHINDGGTAVISNTQSYLRVEDLIKYGTTRKSDLIE